MRDEYVLGELDAKKSEIDSKPKVGSMNYVVTQKQMLGSLIQYGLYVMKVKFVTYILVGTPMSSFDLLPPPEEKT